MFNHVISAIPLHSTVFEQPLFFFFRPPLTQLADYAWRGHDRDGRGVDRRLGIADRDSTWGTGLGILLDLIIRRDDFLAARFDRRDHVSRPLGESDQLESPSGQFHGQRDA